MNQWFKIYIPILLLVFVFINSCKKDSVESPPGTVTAQLSVDTSRISLETITNGQVLLSVEPDVEVQWTVSSKPDWLSITPNSGSLSSSISLSLVVDSSEMEHDQMHGPVEIISDIAGAAGFSLWYYKFVPSKIHTIYDEYTFYYSEDSKSVALRNNSDEPLGWEVESKPEYIIVNPSSSIAEAYDYFDIEVSVNREIMGQGKFESTIILVDEFGRKCHIPLIVHNYVEEKWLLEKVLIMAEFEKNNEIIVALSKSNELLILRPEEETIESININHPVGCFSLNEEGNKAVVACDDGTILVYQIPSLSLVNELTVDNLEASSIAYGPDEMAYFSTHNSSNDSLYTLNLNTGNYYGYKKSWMSNNTTLKFHSGNQALYGIRNNDIFRFDISGDSTYLLYKKEAGYSPGLFFIELGEKVFSGNGVYRISQDLDFDFSLIGSCMDDRCNYFLDVSENKGKIVAKGSEGSYRKYTMLIDHEYLNTTGIIENPGFYDPEIGGSAQGISRYAFFNHDGTKIYTLLQPTSYYDYTNWAIMTYDTDSIEIE